MFFSVSGLFRNICTMSHWINDYIKTPNYCLKFRFFPSLYGDRLKQIILSLHWSGQLTKKQILDELTESKLLIGTLQQNRAFVSSTISRAPSAYRKKNAIIVSKRTDVKSNAVSKYDIKLAVQKAKIETKQKERARADKLLKQSYERQAKVLQGISFAIQSKAGEPVLKDIKAESQSIVQAVRKHSGGKKTLALPPLRVTANMSKNITTNNAGILFNGMDYEERLTDRMGRIEIAGKFFKSEQVMSLSGLRSVCWSKHSDGTIDVAKSKALAHKQFTNVLHFSNFTISCAFKDGTFRFGFENKEMRNYAFEILDASNSPNLFGINSDLYHVYISRRKGM